MSVCPITLGLDGDESECTKFEIKKIFADLIYYRFIPGPAGGLNTTLSNIATLSNFVNHGMPLPIIIANQITDDDVEYYGLKIPYFNSTIVRHYFR
jgi:hypothetical protein